MDTSNLVHMANRIGDFFDAFVDREEAIAGVASHLERFWDPRMRRALLGHVASGGEGLDPLVLEAIARVKTADPRLDS